MHVEGVFPGMRRAWWVTEATVTRLRSTAALDLEQIYTEWLTRLPESLRREAPVPEREMRQLLQCAPRVLDDPSPHALGQAEVCARSLARVVIESATVELLLRYFRDELARALFRHVPHDPRICTAFAQFVSRVGDAFWSAHTENLQLTISRQRDERFEQELLLAKTIQQRLLPRRIPAIPGFDVAGRVLAAREVGGDYWSVKEYPDDGIVTFKLADVTGHGIAAATLVAAVKFISGGFYRGSKSAAPACERA
jgi:hypothetical protein